jgi:hypothetical protein
VAEQTALAYLPLIIIWLGIGEASRITLLTLAMFALIALSAQARVRSVSRERVNAALSLGANPWQLLWEVVFPSALPEIHTGARTRLGAEGAHDTIVVWTDARDSGPREHAAPGCASKTFDGQTLTQASQRACIRLDVRRGRAHAGPQYGGKPRVASPESNMDAFDPNTGGTTDSQSAP